jgi:hypothetical protein
MNPTPKGGGFLAPISMNETGRKGDMLKFQRVAPGHYKTVIGEDVFEIKRASPEHSWRVVRNGEHYASGAERSLEYWRSSLYQQFVEQPARRAALEATKAN